jgi:cytidyltransferase-like protein
MIPFVVFTNGVFDCLHPGHYNLLNYCRYLAGPKGQVVVALDSDEKVKADKGDYRPIFSLEERSEAILSLTSSRSRDTQLIDCVYTFSTNEELYNLIKEIHPFFIVKGSDWKGNVIGEDLFTVKHYDTDKRFSTTKIVERIIKKII